MEGAIGRSLWKKGLVAPLLSGDRGSRRQQWGQAVRVCRECEMAWIPHSMWDIEWLQDPDGFGPRLYLRKLKLWASDDMKTRVCHEMIDADNGPAMIPLIRVDRVLWGSDFSHIRSIGLEAQEHVRTKFGDLPREDQEKVVSGNAAKVLYVE